jgi:hypothetical protein
MSTTQSLYDSLNINLQLFSKKELIILEADLFIRLYEELKKVIREQNKEYFNLMKLTIKKENTMIESNFLRCIIHDILSTEEYNLSGIACYTDTPEDVIYEIAAGHNIRPTLTLARKVIELHRHVRAGLYQEIFNKIIKKDQH